MKRQIMFGLAILLIFGGFFMGGKASSAVAKEPKILEFDSMVGVPSTLTGAQAAATFRGVNAGGLPWTVGSAYGELKASGKLEIDVQGLVFSAGPNTGANTVTSFRALVSCVKNDGTVQNVSTGNFPATTGPASSGGGNAHIEAKLSLPQPCFAPIVFVTSPGGAWFAVTGK
jgi:hypothetical protein